MPDDKKKKLDELANAFREKHSDPLMDYYMADVKGRRAMLEEQLLMQLVESTQEPNVEELRAKVKGPEAQDLLTAVAKKVHGWETCKEMMKETSFQHYAQGKHFDSDTDHKDYIENRLSRISVDPTEQKFRESAPAHPQQTKGQVEHVRKVADDLFAGISEVDFNLLGFGSTQFDEMKKSVKELKRFAHENYKPGENQEISPDVHQQLLEKTRSALEDVKAYLEHKGVQFDNDPERRNAPGRQKHEQPRILKSIDAFEKLSRFYIDQFVTNPGRLPVLTSEQRAYRDKSISLLEQNKRGYTTNLASAQSKVDMDAKYLFNEQDREVMAKHPEQKNEQAAKKSGAPKL